MYFCILLLNRPTSESLFFYELTALYSIPIRLTVAEIWALEVCSVAIVLYYTSGNLCSVKELRELELCENWDSWGLEYFFMYVGTRHWQGSASNISGPAIHCSEQSSGCEWLPFASLHVPCELQRQSPTTATTNVPFNGPTNELNESHHLVRYPREWGWDQQTRELDCCHWFNN